jgi:capsule biosynthesis phosphatase
MRIAIDIDGTICSLRRPGQTYADVAPVPGAVEKLQALKRNGHYLILLTARHMATCQGNVGMVVARQGKTLLDWLARHEIPFDELWFGKPQADVYIDDNALRFTEWCAIADDGENLPKNRERALSESLKAGHPAEGETA